MGEIKLATVGLVTIKPRKVRAGAWGLATINPVNDCIQVPR